MGEVMVVMEDTRISMEEAIREVIPGLTMLADLVDLLDSLVGDLPSPPLTWILQPTLTISSNINSMVDHLVNRDLLLVSLDTILLVLEVLNTFNSLINMLEDMVLLLSKDTRSKQRSRCF